MEEEKKHTTRPRPPGKSAQREKTTAPLPEEGEQEMVEISTKEIDMLKEELEKATSGCSNNLDGWQRERAEFSNYKKRIEREQDSLRQTIMGSIMKKYLVILDDLELALKNRPTEGEGAVWSEGIELITRKLLTILDSEGIERINESGVQFDPNLHEAISNEESDEFESGEIIEVVRQGYKLADRILRPAMVRVAR